MYSYEQRIKAVEQLIQYDMSYSTVMRELGYPSSWRSLRSWYKEYKNGGDLHPKNIDSNQKFTEEAKRKAVDYYLIHGKCVNRTCKKLVLHGKLGKGTDRNLTRVKKKWLSLYP